MARIRIPQTLDRLLQAVEASQFIPLLEKYGAIDSKGRYLHWNDFQWRVDSGDHELAAWVATKIARKSIRDFKRSLEKTGYGIYRKTSCDRFWGNGKYCQKLSPSISGQKLIGFQSL